MGNGKAAHAHRLANDDIPTVEPPPHCPVCWSLACPHCHRADAIVTVWDFPKGSWHHVCRRCSIGFPRD